MTPAQLLRETQRAAGDERLSAWHETLINAGKEAKEMQEVGLVFFFFLFHIHACRLVLLFFVLCLFIARDTDLYSCDMCSSWMRTGHS